MILNILSQRLIHKVIKNTPCIRHALFMTTDFALSSIVKGINNEFHTNIRSNNSQPVIKLEMLLNAKNGMLSSV